MKAKWRVTPVAGKRRKGSLRKHPAFGMWSDRADVKDAAAYVRRLRRARFEDT
jgi:hypothetical protein